MARVQISPWQTTSFSVARFCRKGKQTLKQCVLAGKKIIAQENGLKDCASFNGRRTHGFTLELGEHPMKQCLARYLILALLLETEEQLAEALAPDNI